MQQPLIMVNGVFCDHLSVFDRAVSYGHGLFETMRVVGGKIPLLARHLARLCADSPKLLLPKPELALIENQINQLIAAAVTQWQVDQKNINATVKILYTAGQGGRGYRLPQPLLPNVVLQLMPRNFEKPEKIKVLLCQTKLAASPLAGIKHCNRLEQILAAQELASGNYFEGLVSDMHGHITEGISSNLFLLKDGVMSTPDLSLAGVDGVMRRYLLDRCTSQIVCKTISSDDVLTADQIFLANSNWGVVAVNELQLGEVLLKFKRSLEGDAFTLLGESAFVIDSLSSGLNP